MKKMTLTIVIVNWNTSDLLYNCLNSIKKSNVNIIDRIIVVDNASSDQSRAMVETCFPEVFLINSGDNMGFGKANNIAIPHVRSAYILFLNPDTIVNSNALTQMCNFLENNDRVGAIGCKIIDAQNHIVDLPIQTELSPLKRFFLQIFFSKHTNNIIRRIYPSHNKHKSGFVSHLYGACLMVRKYVFDQVGCFDEQFFMYAEDIDLCKRIGAAGWLLYYIADVDIIHLEGGASEKAPSDFSILMMCESVSKLMKKYYGTKGELIYKSGLLISATSRLIILTLINFPSLINRSDKYHQYIHKRRKHLLVFKWCLNI